jgi:hypothetical protein
MVDNYNDLVADVFSRVAERHGTDKEELLAWYINAAAKLDQVQANSHPRTQKRLARRVRSFQREIENLMQHPLSKQMFGLGGKYIVRDGLADYLERVNDELDTGLSFMDIIIFHQVADFGRKVFQTNSRRPCEFIPDHAFRLIEMIRNNFGAYKETLSGIRV